MNALNKHRIDEKNAAFIQRRRLFEGGVYSSNCVFKLLIYMKKFLHFDWLRAVQFLQNTIPKERHSVQISFDVINSYDTCIFIACLCFSDFSLCYNYIVNSLCN